MGKVNNLVVLVLGSKSDYTWAQKITEYLNKFNLSWEIRIASAHKTPEFALKIVKEIEEKAKNVIYIAIAGRSNALGGFLDANTSSPVINCPPPSEKYSGLDILSSLRMPSGVAPATVLEADQAALLAAKMFSFTDIKIRNKVDNYHHELVAKIKNDDNSIKSVK